MSSLDPSRQQGTATLIKATLTAAALAGLILVTLVLPAEYGIDPTGIGQQLGLNSLHEPTERVTVAAVAPQALAEDAADQQLAAKAANLFGRYPDQSFNARAFSPSSQPIAEHARTLTLEPGRGAELKSHLNAGDGLVFRWSASGDVALDMHGEQPGTQGWTTYAVSGAQREDSGTLVAPFTGTHGWYWKNNGSEPVTVEITLFGFQPDLYRP